MKRAAWWRWWCGAERSGVETTRSPASRAADSFIFRGEFGANLEGNAAVFCRTPFENSDEFDLILDSLAPPSAVVVRARFLRSIFWPLFASSLLGSGVLHACSKRVRPK